MMLEIPSFTHSNGQVGGSIIYSLKWLDASFNECYKSKCFELGIGSLYVEPVHHP
jgi:hypothetical protein